jgi:hypothetical protein
MIQCSSEVALLELVWSVNALLIECSYEEHWITSYEHSIRRAYSSMLLWPSGRMIGWFYDRVLLWFSALLTEWSSDQVLCDQVVYWQRVLMVELSYGSVLFWPNALMIVWPYDDRVILWSIALMIGRSADRVLMIECSSDRVFFESSCSEWSCDSVIFWPKALWLRDLTIHCSSHQIWCSSGFMIEWSYWVLLWFSAPMTDWSFRSNFMKEWSSNRVLCDQEVSWLSVLVELSYDSVIFCALRIESLLSDCPSALLTGWSYDRVLWG